MTRLCHWRHWFDLGNGVSEIIYFDELFNVSGTLDPQDENSDPKEGDVAEEMLAR